MQAFHLITQVARFNRETGHTFFDHDEMKVHDRHIVAEVINNQYFIASTKVGKNPRCYTVYRVCADGHIEPVSSFQQFPAISIAVKFARQQAPVED